MAKKKTKSPIMTLMEAIDVAEQTPLDSRAVARVAVLNALAVLAMRDDPGAPEAVEARRDLIEVAKVLSMRDEAL